MRDSRSLNRQVQYNRVFPAVRRLLFPQTRKQMFSNEEPNRSEVSLLLLDGKRNEESWVCVVGP